MRKVWLYPLCSSHLWHCPISTFGWHKIEQIVLLISETLWSCPQYVINSVSPHQHLGNFIKTARTIFWSCVLLLTTQSWKSYKGEHGTKASGLLTPSDGFIPLSSSIRYEYILANMCLFLAWAETFPCWKATFFIVTKSSLITCF